MIMMARGREGDRDGASSQGNQREREKERKRSGVARPLQKEPAA